MSSLLADEVEPFVLLPLLEVVDGAGEAGLDSTSMLDVVLLDGPRTASRNDEGLGLFRCGGC